MYSACMGLIGLRRDIASAIKDVLDAVNEVSKKHQISQQMKEYKKVFSVPLLLLLCASFCWRGGGISFYSDLG